MANLIHVLTHKHVLWGKNEARFMVCSWRLRPWKVKIAYQRDPESDWLQLESMDQLHAVLENL